MDQGPVFLLNPPAPAGTTVNREGAGGLGVLVPRPRGFTYPAHRLAEAARWFRHRGLAVEAADLVLAPRRGRWRLRRRLRGAAGVVVHVARRSLEHDLAAVAALREQNPGARWHLTGVALREVEAEIARLVPGATVDEAVSGFGAAAAALGEDVPGAEVEGALYGADFSRLPLGPGRRLPLWLGRGCTHACTYCPYVVATGRQHRLRPTEAVLQDLVSSVRAYRPRRIVFRDPVFGLAAAETRELVDWIAALPGGQRVPFEIESRPELLDDDLLARLGAAGCVEIKLGIETLEAAALVATRRVPDAAAAAEYRREVARVMRSARAGGIAVRAFLLRELPGSTPAGDAATARVLEGHEPLVSKAVEPLPGAPGPAR